MFAVLVALALSQTPAAPTVALFERPAPGGALSRERLDALEKVVRLELEQAHVPVSLLPADVKLRLKGTDAEGCVKGMECLFLAGNVLRADAMVSVEASQLEDDVAVSLDAVAPASQRRLARRSFVVKAKDIPAALEAEVRPFAQDVARSMTTTDVPLAIAKTPSGVSVGPGAAASVSAPSHVPLFLASGGAVATAGAAAGLFASALTHDQRAHARDPITDESPLTRAQAEDRIRLANRNASFALASAGLSVALTATAIWLWNR